jgi:hypothetical protein
MKHRPTPGILPMITTVPRRFETLLEAEPMAPALVLVRSGARDRVWIRAAVEHRAVRLAGAFARAGLSGRARIRFAGAGALDRLAVAYFALATGRVLLDDGVDDPGAFVVDDDALRAAAIAAEPYALRSVVRSSDPALALPAVCSHGEVFRAVMAGHPFDSAIGRAIESLALGEPLVIDAGGTESTELRALVYAA